MKVYLFEQGNTSMRELLGGKGCDLCEMTRLGLPVPPGVIITTEVCHEYAKRGFPKGLMEEVKEKLKAVEKKTGRKLGGNPPLLLSVRSGAPVSMPGMMDTILNLGINQETLESFKKTNERLALDCYRRFIQMFGDVVLKIDREKFENILEENRKAAGVTLDSELDAKALERIVAEYKRLVKSETGNDFPEDVGRQLEMAISSVFESWNNQRAKTYRKINRISESMGTAVNIQAMVFGNYNNDSASGVMFTRNPSTGENRIYGEYLRNAQGEDVVAGIRTPQPMESLKKEMPRIYNELSNACALLENHFKDMQDIEFTIEDKKLWILQTRTGKRTAKAAIKTAVDMVKEKLIGKEDAIMRVKPEQVDQLLHRTVDPKAEKKVVAKGLPASPGAAHGRVVFSADDAEKRGEKEKVILVSVETTPDDIHGMVAAQGILTSRGGMTCHAAIVARSMNKPCVVGCEKLCVDKKSKEFVVGNCKVREGDTITIDGTSGEVILGEARLINPELGAEFKEFLAFCDEKKKLAVRANVDTPDLSIKARELGAEGIGLCRTERMFNDKARLPFVQKMILSENDEERRKMIGKLKPMQKSDFYEIFKTMKGLPVNIRLLDLPLHEFLPKYDELLVETTTKSAKGGDVAEAENLLKKIRGLQEFNPMLGHRGCRLGITYPEIYEMQVSAMMEAACELEKENVPVTIEIMVPLVGNANELKILREKITGAAENVIKNHGVKVDYKIGTMIEVPRACLTADEIAAHADFFSFGTNDLTQTTLGFSRDDAESKFLVTYLENKILDANPFEVLDFNGVGKLVMMTVELGRKAKPGLKIGICGETGGEPESIEFYHNAGLDYVSCSTFRIPIARLAAAQAAIRGAAK